MDRYINLPNNPLRKNSQRILFYTYFILYHFNKSDFLGYYTMIVEKKSKN